MGAIAAIIGAIGGLATVMGICTATEIVPLISPTIHLDILVRFSDNPASEFNGDSYRA